VHRSPLDRRAIGEPDALEGETRVRQPRLLQPRGAVVVEVVDANHGAATRQQPLGNAVAEETGRACQRSGS
jgi:hypothetical protein